MSTRVLILYNEPMLSAEHRDACAEHEILYTVTEIDGILAKAGYKVERLGAHVDPQAMIRGIKKARPDVVFNLFEGVPQMNQTEAYAAGILEWMGVPYTGCPFQSLVLARDKPLTKLLLKGAGIATPNYRLIGDGPVKPCKLGWPVIVKPSNQDASAGMDQSSVVTSQEAFEERVRFIMGEYGAPVLVEEFIDGREFNVAVVESPDLRVMPPWEIKFNDRTDGRWPIITYDAKWYPGSRDYEASPSDYKPAIEPPVRRRIERTARKVFALLGCRDVARVDMRVTPAGKPYVLEMNPNPDFSPTGGIAEALEAGGLTHGGLTVHLVENALRRGATRLEAPVNLKIVEW